MNKRTLLSGAEASRKPSQGGQGGPSTSGLWPVGSHPELDVPDERQINPSPNISTFLAQFQGDSPTVMHCDSPLSHRVLPLLPNTVELHSVIFKPVPLKATGFLTQFLLPPPSSSDQKTVLSGVCQGCVNHLTSVSTPSTPGRPTSTHINIYTCVHKSQQ